MTCAFPGPNSYALLFFNVSSTLNEISMAWLCRLSTDCFGSATTWADRPVTAKCHWAGSTSLTACGTQFTSNDTVSGRYCHWITVKDLSPMRRYRRRLAVVCGSGSLREDCLPGVTFVFRRPRRRRLSVMIFSTVSSTVGTRKPLSFGVQNFPQLPGV